MARTVANVTELLRVNNCYEEKAAVAIDTTSGLEISLYEKDRKYAIALINTGSSPATVNIEAGDHNVISAPLSLSVPANKTVWLNIDSMRFKKTQGEDKDKVILRTTGTVSVKVVRLP